MNAHHLDQLLNDCHPQIRLIAVVPTYKGFFIWAKQTGWKAHGEKFSRSSVFGPGEIVDGYGESPYDAIKDMHRLSYQPAMSQSYA
jgi:hypothetical protein